MSQKLRRILCALAAVPALLGAGASPSMAVVGGQDASPGEYPSVAEITFGVFGCTGTLISPTWVLTAGHCESLTGATGLGSPAGWPVQLIDVRIGNHRTGTGGDRVPVKRAIIHPNYLLNPGYDISLLELSRPSTMAPTQVAGAADRGLWDAGDIETIVGWGVTEEGGDAPTVLQEARVPVTTDAYCDGAYSDFDSRTMVCAGYEAGGVDTCQGDSGGPMLAIAGGVAKVVGATSFGEGCARPGRPGVYARVADPLLRNWIAGHAPAAVSG